MTATSLTNGEFNQDVASTSRQINLELELSQDRIYNFLLEIVKKRHPEDVLREFQRLFIDCIDLVNLDYKNGIYSLFGKKNEQDFRNTIKRCCYILINNWESSRQYKYIHKLIELFANYQPKGELNRSREITVYRKWLENFILSSDYQDLKLFAYKHEESDKVHWVNRYSSYLLFAQSVDKNNPKEQQEVARKIYKKLQEKFKFELAIYIARSQSNHSSANRYKNPSILGDNALRLIKAIALKKGLFSYDNIANIFLKQTQNKSFKEFKESLAKYLIFSVEQPIFVETLRDKLSDKLWGWKTEYNDKPISKELRLRTCNKVIDILTTENRKEPSPLFILLLSKGHPLTLVIVLLKIIMICRSSRGHLERRIADLIHFYEDYPESECFFLIKFLEIYRITFAIYTENVEYNLIKVQPTEEDENLELNPDAYHVFSQLKINGKK